MRKRILAVIAAVALVSIGGIRIDAYDGSGLAVQQSIYIAGSDGDPNNILSHPHVDADGSLTLKPSQALKCDAMNCTFELGVVAYRTVLAGEVTTYGQFSVDGGSTFGHSIVFKAKQASVNFVTPVVMALGKHTVTFAFNPPSGTAVKNPTVTAYFDVAADGPPAGGSGNPPIFSAFPNLWLSHLEWKTTSQILLTINNTCSARSAATTLRLDIYKEQNEKGGVAKSVTAAIPAIGPEGSTVVTLSTGLPAAASVRAFTGLFKITLDPDNWVRETLENDNVTTVNGAAITYSHTSKCGVK